MVDSTHCIFLLITHVLAITAIARLIGLTLMLCQKHARSACIYTCMHACTINYRNIFYYIFPQNMHMKLIINNLYHSLCTCPHALHIWPQNITACMCVFTIHAWLYGCMWALFNLPYTPAWSCMWALSCATVTSGHPSILQICSIY